VIFDAQFWSSAASELFLFLVWLGIGVVAVLTGGVLVLRNNRLFARQTEELNAVEAEVPVELASAA
jgi:uncharacterized membrane protein